MRQRRVDLHGLAGDAHLLVWRQVLEGAHVVEPIGQLDDDDSHVLGHGHEHLSDVLGLLLLHGPGGAELGELRDSVYEAGHLAPEPLLDVRQRHVRVFGDVVQKGRSERLGVHLKLGQVVGDLQRVRDVRLAGCAELSLVGGCRHLVGALDQADVEARPMTTRLGDDVLDGVGFGRGLWGARDALHHGGRSRTQACEVHGAEILHAGPGMRSVCRRADNPCAAMQRGAGRPLAV